MHSKTVIVSFNRASSGSKIPCMARMHWWSSYFCQQHNIIRRPCASPDSLPACQHTDTRSRSALRLDDLCFNLLYIGRLFLPRTSGTTSLEQLSIVLGLLAFAIGADSLYPY